MMVDIIIMTTLAVLGVFAGYNHGYVKGVKDNNKLWNKTMDGIRKDLKINEQIDK